MLQAQTAAPMMGAVMAELDYRALGKLIDSYKNDPENLIMILQGVQRKYNYFARAGPEIYFRKACHPA